MKTYMKAAVEAAVKEPFEFIFMPFVAVVGVIAYLLPWFEFP